MAGIKFETKDVREFFVLPESIGDAKIEENEMIGSASSKNTMRLMSKRELQIVAISAAILERLIVSGYIREDIKFEDWLEWVSEISDLKRYGVIEGDSGYWRKTNELKQPGEERRVEEVDRRVKDLEENLYYLAYYFDDNAFYHNSPLGLFFGRLKGVSWEGKDLQEVWWWTSYYRKDGASVPYWYTDICEGREVEKDIWFSRKKFISERSYIWCIPYFGMFAKDKAQRINPFEEGSRYIRRVAEMMGLKMPNESDEVNGEGEGGLTELLPITFEDELKRLTGLKESPVELLRRWVPTRRYQQHLIVGMSQILAMMDTIYSPLQARLYCFKDRYRRRMGVSYKAKDIEQVSCKVKDGTILELQIRGESFTVEEGKSGEWKEEVDIQDNGYAEGVFLYKGTVSDRTVGIEVFAHFEERLESRVLVREIIEGIKERIGKRDDADSGDEPEEMYFRITPIMVNDGFGEFPGLYVSMMDGVSFSIVGGRVTEIEGKNLIIDLSIESGAVVTVEKPALERELGSVYFVDGCISGANAFKERTTSTIIFSHRDIKVTKSGQTESLTEDFKDARVTVSKGGNRTGEVADSLRELVEADFEEAADEINQAIGLNVKEVSYEDGEEDAQEYLRAFRIKRFILKWEPVKWREVFGYDEIAVKVRRFGGEREDEYTFGGRNQSGTWWDIPISISGELLVGQIKEVSAETEIDTELLDKLTTKKISASGYFDYMPIVRKEFDFDGIRLMEDQTVEESEDEGYR